MKRLRVPLNEKFPPVKRIRWFNLSVLVITPALALYGLFTVPINFKTSVFAVLYYVLSMLGITAGYHRLWSHRSYKASPVLQVILILAGTSAVQGSCYWWSRKHRSHHRHTDTDLDPYNAKRGLLWSHIGWVVFESNLPSGNVDLSDLRNDPLIQWQHRWYFPLLIIFGYALPTAVPGLLWADWKGGFYFAGVLRLTIAHHSTFSINSIAHWLGSTSYDDKLTPRDHLLSALLTMGEGYHNFHHQFPMDYRNAFRWYQYDPTKWFIAACNLVGLANNLRVFPCNEIGKCALTMKLKELKGLQESLAWPIAIKDLPVVTWDVCTSINICLCAKRNRPPANFRDLYVVKEESNSRTVILISGFIHDVSSFLDQHPGGPHLLSQNSGKDMTLAFFGGVYDHSNAAHNLLAMTRVGILAGGVELATELAVPPSQRLYIASRDDDHFL